MHTIPEIQQSALLVIDVINSCAQEQYERYGITFNKIRHMAYRLDTFIADWWINVGSPVIYVKTVPWQKKFLPENINLLYTDPYKAFYTEDSSGNAEEFYEVVPDPDDIIICKDTYSCFSSKELRQYLEENDIRTLVTTGVFTDGCVLASVVDGFSRGYNFVLLRDLIETTDEPDRQALQTQLMSYTFPVMYGTVMESTEMFAPS
jgi:biuret amidohydrolase